MKPITPTAAILLAFLCQPGLLTAQETTSGRDNVVVVDRPPIEKRLNGVTSWDLGNGVKFSVREHDRRTEFLDAEGNIIHLIEEPQYVDEVVVVGAVSDDGNIVVIDAFERSGRRWQTWRLQPMEHLGFGLTVAKVLTKGMRLPREGPADEIPPENATRVKREKHQWLDVRTPELRDYVNGVKPWNHGNGVTSRIRWNGTTTELTDGHGNVVRAIRPTDHIAQVVASDSGSSLLFSVWKGGFNRYLLRARVVEGDLKVDELWQREFDLVPGHPWFPSDLGAISDDGEKVLVKVAEAGHIDNWQLYRWQTWRLDPAERLGIGMTVANGLTFGSGQYGRAESGTPRK